MDSYWEGEFEKLRQKARKMNQRGIFTKSIKECKYLLMSNAKSFTNK